jgi:hypothetical protein
MKILSDRRAVIERITQAGENGIPLLCPNAETPEEMAGILLGAERHAGTRGLSSITRTSTRWSPTGSSWIAGFSM